MSTLLHKMRQLLRYILWESDFDVVDFWGGANLIGWGIWYLMPWSLFMGSVYAGFRVIMTENTWAAVMIGIGLARLLAIGFDHVKDILWLRIVVVFLSTMTWIFSAALFAQANYRTSLTYISIFLSVVSVWELVRVIRRYLIRKHIKSTRPHE